MVTRTHMQTGATRLFPSTLFNDKAGMKLEDQAPDFFIVGAPKCGTSSIHDWLSRHPDVYAPRKEPCFFSQDVFPTSHLESHIPTLAEYQRIFLPPGTEDQLSGEATPKYLYSDAAISEIARLRPDAKLIICLRDPVDLAVSLHAQKLKEGMEKEPDFESAWKRELRRIKSGWAPPCDITLDYVTCAKLGAGLQRVFETFSYESIHIIEMVDLKDAPEEVYRRLLRFLDLCPFELPSYPTKNRRRIVRHPRLHRLLLSGRRALRPHLRFLAGHGLGDWVQQLALPRSRSSQRIESSLRKRIEDELLADSLLRIELVARWKMAQQ